MSCQENYIAIDRNSPSRSGLYASDLPGVEELVYELISKDSETVEEVWERIYSNGWNNLVSDVENYLQGKFFINTKLISRETSEFGDEVNASVDMPGIKIGFDLPRYGRLHVISLEVWSEQDSGSPGLHIQFFKKDESGTLLHELYAQVTEGLNTINIDRDFEVDDLFIGVENIAVEIRETQNKHFTGCTTWTIQSCVFPCMGGNGRVEQVNGGGLNVVYNVYCSAEKFVCQNINLFRKTFWWKIGQELIIERRYGNRLNQFTTMTQERAEELTEFYQEQYSQSLENSLHSHNIYEDPICFECKGVISVKTNLA